MASSANSPIEVAIVGYGLAGRTFHAPVIARTAGYRVRSIVTTQSHTPPAGAHIVRDVASVLTDPAVELVVIATPNTTHASLAKSALAAGKNVVIDKPFATTLAEAEEVAELARTSGLTLAVFHNRRWDADFLTLREVRDSGRLGDVVELHSHLDRYRPEVPVRWREEPAPGAGLWFDLGPHLVDQALQLFGRPRQIVADIANLRHGARVDDYFSVNLRYDGCRVHLHGTALAAAHAQRFIVHGTRASWVKHGIDQQESQLKAGCMPGDRGWGEDPSPGELVEVIDGHVHRTPTPGRAGDFREFYAGLHATLRRGAALEVTVEEALDVMWVLEEAAKQAQIR